MMAAVAGASRAAFRASASIGRTITEGAAAWELASGWPNWRTLNEALVQAYPQIVVAFQPKTAFFPLGTFRGPAEHGKRGR